MIYISDSNVRTHARLEIGLPAKTGKRRKAKHTRLPLTLVETGLDVMSEWQLEIFEHSDDFLGCLYS